VKAILAIIQMLISFPVLASDPRPFVQGSWQELRQQHSGRPMVVQFLGSDLRSVPYRAASME
jgi:hypothetical protein